MSTSSGKDRSTGEPSPRRPLKTDLRRGDLALAPPVAVPDSKGKVVSVSEEDAREAQRILIEEIRKG